MSANNGNRSRFHVDRKRRIARLAQTRAIAKAIADKRATAAAPGAAAKQDETGSTPGAK